MKNLSIVLPIFNEKNSLTHVIGNWSSFLNGASIKHEFLMCEDGSTDGSRDLIIELEKSYPIVNLSTPNRRGYSGGVIAGIKAASYDLILCIDSDGQCMPDSFESIFNLIDSCDIAIGVRSPRRDPFIRKVYSGLFLILHKLLFNTKIKDPSCPYVLARKKVYLQLLPKLGYMREGFWWGFIGAAIKFDMKISELNIKHYPRFDGSTVVYKLSKMPAIITRNIIGLFKLRFS